MRNVPAFLGALLLALFLSSPGSAYFLAGAAVIVFGPAAMTAAALGALWTLGAFIDLSRAPAARTIARLAAIAALGAAVLTGAVSLAHAEPPPLSCDQKRAAVLEYIDAATAFPDMSEEDRRALRGALSPIAEVVCQ